jgi:hypothetical protein
MNKKDIIKEIIDLIVNKHIKDGDIIYIPLSNIDDIFTNYSGRSFDLHQLEYQLFNLIRKYQSIFNIYGIVAYPKDRRVYYKDNKVIIKPSYW